MANGNDRKHFEDYREQTRVKHDILAAYLPAYYNILKGSSKNLVYIDGFAGRGTYTQAETGDTLDGSPLLALKLIADNMSFSRQVSTVFIEANEIHFKQLKSNVEAFYKEHPEIRKPICRFGDFSDRVNEILRFLNGKLAPTFLFVDPCGVKGVSFDTISAVMECHKCEAFIFFNIDGIRRIAGLNAVSPVLVDLMGTKERAQELYDARRMAATARQREQVILSHYRRAIIEVIGAKYVIPFRVEHEDQRKASHYLIHAAKHPLGFRIMKNVMWKRGHAEDQPGALEFRQKGRMNFIPLFKVHDDEIKKNVLDSLKPGSLRVSVFYEDWTGRPDDMECQSSYRQVLLELEADGKIEVLGKDGKNVCGSDARPKRKGKPTLGEDYFLRLRK